MYPVMVWISIWTILAASVHAWGQQAAPSESKGAAVPPSEMHPPAKPAAPGGMRESIEQQRKSVRRQAELLGNWMLPFEGPQYLETPCEPIANAIVEPMIEGAAREQKVESKLLRAVIEQESSFHPCAISSRGAKGLMQLMPETASELSVHDPFDPKENIEAGSKFLKQLLDRYGGDLSQALAAYNAGPARVDQVGGVPDIPETRDYVESILGKLRPRDKDPPAEPQLAKPVKN